MYDVVQTVLSQYATSPSLTAIIESVNEAIDPAANLVEFYDTVWNLATATGFGLDNWGLILGVSRYLNISTPGQYFGFTESGNDWGPFNQAPFYSGGSFSTVFALTDQAYRQLLLAKAKANISDCSIATLNKVAQTVFGSGAMFVADLGNMAMAYLFTSLPSAVNQAIALSSGVLPHPTGVAISVGTAQLAAAQLVAATQSTQTGFGSGFGTLTPSTDVNGHVVATAAYSTTPNFVYQVNSAASLTSGYFTKLIISGPGLAQTILNASGATFGFSAGVNTWTWTSGLPVLVAGTTYTLTVY
jgi:hypothetical protein